MVQMEVQVVKVQWVMLAHRVEVAILVQQVHLGLRAVLGSLASKANWEMWASLDSKEMLDQKENLVLLVPKECLDHRAKREREVLGETLVLWAPLGLSGREELLVTEVSLVQMDCLVPRVRKETVEPLAHLVPKLL